MNWEGVLKVLYLEQEKGAAHAAGAEFKSFVITNTKRQRHRTAIYPRICAFASDPRFLVSVSFL